MAKTLLRELRPHVKLYRDPNTGIAWIEDGTSGTGTALHPNISSSGSIRGMRDRGHWRKDERTLRSHGFIYNIDQAIQPRNADERAIFTACNCGGKHDAGQITERKPASSKSRKTGHRHTIVCLEGDAHGKLYCKVTGETPDQYEVYDASTNLEASAAHFGRARGRRYYTDRKAAQLDADDMNQYHKRYRDEEKYKVRTV